MKPISRDAAAAVIKQRLSTLRDERAAILKEKDAEIAHLEELLGVYGAPKRAPKTKAKSKPRRKPAKKKTQRPATLPRKKVAKRPRKVTRAPEKLTSPARKATTSRKIPGPTQVSTMATSKKAPSPGSIESALGD